MKIKVKLYKWNIDIVALESPYSLFDEEFTTFNKIYNLAQKTACNVYPFKK